MLKGGILEGAPDSAKFNLLIHFCNCNSRVGIYSEVVIAPLATLFSFITQVKPMGQAIYHEVFIVVVRKEIRESIYLDGRRQRLIDGVFPGRSDSAASCRHPVWASVLRSYAVAGSRVWRVCAVHGIQGRNV